MPQGKRPKSGLALSAGLQKLSHLRRADGNHGYDDAFGSGPLQRASRFVSCGSGRQDVVHDEQRLAVQVCSLQSPERAVLLDSPLGR